MKSSGARRRRHVNARQPQLRLGGAMTAALIASAVALATAADGQESQSAAPNYRTWDQYLGGADSSQYSSLDQVDRSNVTQLEVVWTYQTGEGGNYLFNPIVVDGVMYVLAKNRSIIALDAATGRELWTHPNDGGVGARGINYWQSEDRTDRRLLFLNQGFLTAIDARTGRTVNSFGTNGRVDLRVGLVSDVGTVRPLQTSNPGRIFENLVIMSLPAGGASYNSTPADIHAYDVRTGELEWVFHTVPRPGEFGAETWPNDARDAFGGVHNWSESTVDVDLPARLRHLHDLAACHVAAALPSADVWPRFDAFRRSG
jgi:quinoprotein glucose dehydrogenase